MHKHCILPTHRKGQSFGCCPRTEQCPWRRLLELRQPVNSVVVAWPAKACRNCSRQLTLFQRNLPRHDVSWIKQRCTGQLMHSMRPLASLKWTVRCL